MTRKKPRGLRPEEQALWAEVARSANPLHSDYKPKTTDTSAKPLPKTPAPAPKPSIEPFEVGARAKTRLPSHDLRPALSKEVASAPRVMDKNAYRQMQRGKLKPEGRIDLHGMTVSHAHGALTAFVLSSHAAGKRLVLVITGKGRVSDDDSPIPTRTGILRHQVPHWLSLPPLAGIVLQVAEAHQRHGGSGAFYVYLRRH